MLERLGLNGYHMFFDGALVYNPTTSEEVYVNPIPPESVREFIAHLNSIGLETDLYSVTRFFAERESWTTDIRRDFFKITATIVDFRNIWQTERLIKGTLVVRSAEDKAKAAEVCEYFRGKLHFSWTRTPAYPEIDFINVIAPGSSKGKSLEALVAFMGISTSEVMAIGDGTNDIPLLATAGLAVAMGNATDEVKAAADYITAPVGRDGVAEAIRRFLL
jgi:hypothetical protein